MDELHSNKVFQPKAKVLPQAQLAAFLRNKVDWESDSVGLSDINRSSSAPPTQLGFPEKLKLESELNETSPSDPRLNPEYAAYYYQHSRLDPRLPPPLYTPGQSWQYWSAPGMKKITILEQLTMDYSWQEIIWVGCNHHIWTIQWINQKALHCYQQILMMILIIYTIKEMKYGNKIFLVKVQ